MQHVKFPAANIKYDPPKDWDAAARGVEVFPLYALTTRVGETDAIMSVWKPDEAEIEALKNGHAVVLVVLGTSMPPVRLTVSDAPLKPVANDQGAA